MLILIRQLDGTPFDETIVNRTVVNVDDDCAAPAKGLLQETLRQILAR